MENIEKIFEERPWGNFKQFTKNKQSTVKIINVKAGEALSLQYHDKRSEFWHILEGQGLVTVGDDKLPASKDSEFFIPKGSNHRIEASTDMVFLEIAFGEFDEKDIVRLEDKYQRS